MVIYRFFCCVRRVAVIKNFDFLPAGLLRLRALPGRLNQFDQGGGFGFGWFCL